MSWIKAVGIGPGDPAHMTGQAANALREGDAVVGYNTYLNLIKPIIQDKEVFGSGMRQEILRCKKALELAQAGKKVCVISSGDPGIYGMAGLLLELCVKEDIDIDIEVIPGVSAVNAAASLLGAPLMHDFAMISLSDHLTPWQVIEKRLDLSAQADFVIALYNPKSRERKHHLERALEIISQHKSSGTPVGIVKNALRAGERVIVSTLASVAKEDIDMTSIVIIGNRHTFAWKNRIITPRGYEL